MNFFGGSNLALLPAHLTQRKSCNVSITYSFPCTAVPLAHCRVSVVLLVASIFLTLMLLAEPSGSQLWTAGVRTWSLRFVWHNTHSIFIQKKNLQRLSCPLKVILIFLHYYFSTGKCDICDNLYLSAVFFKNRCTICLTPSSVFPPPILNAICRQLSPLM